MKKVLPLLFVLLLLAGCRTQEEENSEVLERQQEKISLQKEHIADLNEDIVTLEEHIQGIKDEHGIKRYFVTVSVKQKHMTMDLSEHMKDKMNELTFQIPVDEEYFNDVEVGMVIDDSFRMGSFISAGSVGSWDIKVVDKSIE